MKGVDIFIHRLYNKKYPLTNQIVSISFCKFILFSIKILTIFNIFFSSRPHAAFPHTYVHFFLFIYLRVVILLFFM